MERKIFTEKLLDTFENITASTNVSAADGLREDTKFTIALPESFFNSADPSAPLVFSATEDVISAIGSVLSTNWRGSITMYPT